MFHFFFFLKAFFKTMCLLVNTTPFYQTSAVFFLNFFFHFIPDFSEVCTYILMNSRFLRKGYLDPIKSLIYFSDTSVNIDKLSHALRNVGQQASQIVPSVAWMSGSLGGVFSSCRHLLSFYPSV